MADNTNAQAVKFGNEKVRLFAESLLDAIETAKAFKVYYEDQGGTALFPATADNLADGSETDGRPRLSNNSVRALYQAALDMVTWAANGTPTREARLRAIVTRGGSKI